MLNIRLWTLAWFTLCAVLAAHIVEEAQAVSGAGIELLRLIFPALPPFQYSIWLVDIVGAVLALVALTWQVQRQNPWMRAASYALALFTTANAMMHILVSYAENEVFAGTVTAPAMLLASLFLLLSIPRGNVPEKANIAAGAA
jgi:hypothetical protein